MTRANAAAQIVRETVPAIPYPIIAAPGRNPAARTRMRGADVRVVEGEARVIM
ncbi:MAG: hypothetical protein Q8S03_15960 [Brevundimonas sp.]|uniref:hypothetical protein n=1 Tax=Brevundimonas sp. TaxID=1871086 RepID=UPI002735939E|nr:hypothetical protein [Brevundimonas sp.]MDP3406184.1 hypothetical protein [Brevundimonas sp.]